MWRRIIIYTFVLVALSSGGAEANILTTKHNLSSSAPMYAPDNTIYSETEDQVCIFCHTPHNASPAVPLWNHELSTTPYTMYTSRSINYDPESYNKPTGSSRLCLSCHDGTVAVGDFYGNASLSLKGTDPDGTITSPTNIGVDLSDDHPVSIPVNETDELWAPEQHGLTSEVQLEDGLVQCSSCHDAHGVIDATGNIIENFLVKSVDEGILCRECHHQDGWDQSAHGAASGVSWTDLSGATKTVAQWACLGCHDMHRASEQELLQNDGNPDRSLLEEVCYRCHDGSAAPAIEQEFLKTFSHPVQNEDYDHIHYANEPNPPGVTHVECSDCHDPHHGESGNRELGDDSAGGMLKGILAPQIGPQAPYTYPTTQAWTPPAFGPIHEITYEYELCFKCHSTKSAMQLSNDHKEEIDVYFNPNNMATHGCVSPGKNRNPYTVSGFNEELGWTSTTTIACSDCHGNDDISEGRIRGPHGSYSQWLLRAVDPSIYSDNAGNAVVCYLCHDPQVYGKNGTESSRSAFPAHSKGGHWNNRPDYPPGVPKVGCFICHGDFSRQETDGYTAGGLHGANSGRADRPLTTRGTHFLNGFGIEIISSEQDLVTPNATISCGDYYDTTTGFGCSKHATTSYRRPDY